MTPREVDLLRRVILAREAAGLHTTYDDRVADAARMHAEDMARHPGLTHTGSDGLDGGERLRRAGYEWSQWGEVVGWGFGGDTAQMVQWWLNSPEHRDALLDPDVTDIGVGYVDAPGTEWEHYWAVNFGSTRTTATDGFDLRDYLCGDGRSYRVGNSRGTFEVFQSQDEGERFYQVKAWDDLSVVNWEEFTLSTAFIGRDIDTSPGGRRYYRQFGAAWVTRRMRVGESFTQSKRVQFYMLADCSPSAPNSGNVTDTIKLAAHHARYTFRTGVALDDVLELHWLQGGERYFYARLWGLVGWERLHDDPHSPAWSAIAEPLPGVGRLERLRIHCL